MQREFDVALSFAGEDRKHAKALADLLKFGCYTVFYDEYEQAELWGKNLYDHLSSVYKDKARFCVMFLSKNYARKLWTRHERESAQARAFEESREFILPVRLDDTEFPGILSTVGYLDLREVSIEQVYQALEQKLLSTVQTQVAAATSISTTRDSTSHCCKNCHFLAKCALTEGGQEHKWTWDAKERSDLKVKEHYGVECAKGIWSAGIDPEINSRLEEELLKERNECFFLEYDEANKSMTFDAATELLQLRGEEPHQIREATVPVEQASEPRPLSEESAVTSLKRFLAEPRYRIQLADLIDETVGRVIEETSGKDFDTNHPPPTTETVTARIRAYEEACSTLMEMAVIGGRWAEEVHCDIWQRALQRLATVPRVGGIVLWLDLRRYPATLLLYALGLGAVCEDRLDFLGRLFSTTVRRQNYERDSVTQYLAPDLYLDGDAQAMQILEGMSRHYFPLNDWIYRTSRHSTKAIIPEDDQYTFIFDKLEILISLNAWHNSHPGITWLRPLGVFMYRYETSWEQILPDIEGSILNHKDESPFVKANLFGSSADHCWRNLFDWYNWISTFSHSGSSPFSAHPQWGKRDVNSVHFGSIRVGDPNQWQVQT